MSGAVHAPQGHRVWRFGADIDTDVLAPGAYMKLGIEGIAPHCLESVRPEFARQVQRGDVIVAGPNFGIGSSREQAAAALLGDKQPSLQFTTPDQLGALAVFLCSDAAINVRGVAWNMDGGWVAQ